MQLIGALLIIIGIIDFGLSWIGIDLTSQFVGTSLSQYTPIIFGIIGGILYSIGGKGGEKEQINSESHNITVEDNTSITNTQNNDYSIESKLEKLKSMLDKELITEEEFNTKKQKLIDEM